MFFSRTGGAVKSDGYGRVYVFRFTLDDGTVLHKVGMTHSDRALDRFMEVLRSFFTTFRYVPNASIRRDKKVVVPLLVEKHIHNLLYEHNHRFDKKFDGYKEFFHNIDEEVLLDYLDNFTYNILLEESGSMAIVDYEAIRLEMRDPKDPRFPMEDDKVKF